MKTECEKARVRRLCNQGLEKTALYVMCRFDMLLPPEHHLSVENLYEANLNVTWYRLLASGVQVVIWRFKRDHLLALQNPQVLVCTGTFIQ